MKIILAIINGVPERLPVRAVNLSAIEDAIRLYCVDRCISYLYADVTLPDWPSQGSHAEKLRGYERLVVLPNHGERLLADRRINKGQDCHDQAARYRER